MIEATRAVVYADDDHETFIDAGDLDDALRGVGVEVGKAEDGTTAYDDVPEDVSLRAAHLAVDFRRDPEKFLNPVERRPDRDATDS